LLREAGSLAGDLGASRGELIGPVSLGCFTGLASNILPAVLEGMITAHPRIQISITVGDHADLIPAIEMGALDTAIVYDIDLPPDLELRVIYATEGMAVLAADDPLLRQEEIDLAELAHKPLIMLDTAPSKDYTARAFQDRGLVPIIGAVVPQIDLVRALVGRGLGYSLLMSRPNQVPVSSEGRKLVTRRLRPRAGQTFVVAVWPKAAPLPPRARAVIEYAVDVLGTIVTS